jgi:hypothetical protein
METENINTQELNNGPVQKAESLENGLPETNPIKDADKEQNQEEDEEEETLNLTKPGEDDASWISHWPLLTALLILLVMLTLQFGFKYQPPFPAGWL